LSAGGHIVHLCLRLEFGEDTFLGTATIMEGQYLFGRELLVGNDHLEVIAICVGDKQIQLDGAFILLTVLTSDKYKTVSIAPA